MTGRWNPKALRKIHFFGDSLTAGYPVNPKDGWVAVLQQRVPDIQFYNHAQTGIGLSEILSEMKFFLAKADDLTGFFLMGGTNDIFSGIRVTMLENAMKSAIEEISSAHPLLIGLPPLTTPLSIITGWQRKYNYEMNNQDLARYNEFTKKICRAHSVPFIDFAAALPQESKWYDDGVHPNVKGYLKLADAAEKYFK